MKHFYKSLCPESGSMFTFKDLYSQIVKEVPDGGTLVEIGAWIGQSLAYLIVESINSGKKHKIYAVDAFVGNVFSGIEKTTYPQWTAFQHNLQPVWEHLTPIQSLSDEAASRFLDNSIDFAYVDAQHTLEAVRKDLAAWWPKIKPGGIFAGHDLKHLPVRQAVEEFSKQINIPFIESDEVTNSWIIRKPNETER